jgi:hypothetical protein
MAGTETRLITLTIANNAAVTDAINLKPGERLIAVKTPSGWTAADLCLQLSDDGGTTFFDCVDIGGTLLRLTAIALAAVELRVFADDVNPISAPLGPLVCRLRSVNTASAADVNQGGARTVKVVVTTAPTY